MYQSFGTDGFGKPFQLFVEGHSDMPLQWSVAKASLGQPRSFCRSTVALLPLRRNFISSSLTKAADNAESEDDDPGLSRALGVLQKAADEQTRQKPLSKQLSQISREAVYQAQMRPSAQGDFDNEPYHLNVYAHKHNMHITFTKPSRDPILSLSAGNMGFRKAQRSSWDTCFQLAGYTLRKMMEKQWRKGGKKTDTATVTMNNVGRIEVVLRGFGPGREAFQKALLGPEGRFIKSKVVKVTDATRLKFGGTRSPAVRRLG